MTEQNLTVAENNELRISYQMYVEAYDYTLDERPPLDFDTWVDMYGPDILREAKADGRL